MTAVQVDPQAVQPILVTTPAGGLALDAGRQVVARVVEVNVDGSGARISLGGHVVSVQSDVQLRAGDTLSLTVQGTDAGTVRLALNAAPNTTPVQPPTTSPATQPDGGVPPLVADRRLAEIAPAAIRELARSGVPVTPQLAQAVSSAIERLVGQPVVDPGAAVARGSEAAAAQGAPKAAPLPTAGTPPSIDVAARAVANLAARNITLSPAAAARVVAALELSGNLGSELARLAQVSPQVAAALPTVPPGAAALRALVGSTLTPAELAVARIAQASEAAVQAQPPGMNLPRPPISPNVVVTTSYVASQVAQTTKLDHLASQSTGALPAQGTPSPVAGSAPAQATTPTGAPVPAPAGSSPGAIQQSAAAVRGEAGAPSAAAVRGEAAAGAIPPRDVPAAQRPLTAAPGVPTGGTSPTVGAPQPRPAAAATTASDVAMSAAGRPSTPPAVAQAVAELSVAMTRFAGALAPGEGPIGEAVRALATPSAQAAAGPFTPAAAGGGPNGAPAPLVVALQDALLGSRTGEGQQQASRALLQAFASASSGDVARALAAMPESESLRVAGMLLDLAASQARSAPSPHAAVDLRHAIHNALDDIGRALQGGVIDEHNVLRAALEHVAAHDPRPAVAEQATRLLHAADGQQVLSAPRAGADPGYVYFQLPLPGQRSAEVVVRREPGRRTVSFDQFNIAFLLSTESMGSLMIQLDAHPAAVRATIRTDQPALEPFLAAQAEALREPVEREARRPVMLNIGVFDDGCAPTSLLEPQLGLIPGENAYYA